GGWRIVESLGERVRDGDEQARRLGARRRSRREVREEVERVRSPSNRISRRIVSWAYGGEADAAGAAVLGGRAGGGRARAGAADPRARPSQPTRVDAAEGDARPRRVERDRKRVG